MRIQRHLCIRIAFSYSLSCFITAPVDLQSQFLLEQTSPSIHIILCSQPEHAPLDIQIRLLPVLGTRVLVHSITGTSQYRYRSTGLVVFIRQHIGRNLPGQADSLLFITFLHLDIVVALQCIAP